MWLLGFRGLIVSSIHPGSLFIHVPLLVILQRHSMVFLTSQVFHFLPPFCTNHEPLIHFTVVPHNQTRWTVAILDITRISAFLTSSFRDKTSHVVTSQFFRGVFLEIAVTI